MFKNVHTDIMSIELLSTQLLIYLQHPEIFKMTDQNVFKKCSIHQDTSNKVLHFTRQHFR